MEQHCQMNELTFKHPPSSFIKGNKRSQVLIYIMKTVLTTNSGKHQGICW